MKDDFIVIMYLTFILNIIIFLFSIIKIIIRRKKDKPFWNEKGERLAARFTLRR